MIIEYTKYHGLGNDFIITHEKHINDNDVSTLTRNICDRHTGIGADGLILISESNKLEFIYYNSDGSRASMCGNGLRCFAKYLYDNKLIESLSFTVDTLAGKRDVKINSTSPFTCTVNMGKPIYETTQIPMTVDEDSFLNKDISIKDKTYKISALNTGVPHVVLYTDEIKHNEVLNTGHAICHHNLFPEQTNVNFVKLIDKQNIEVQTFERGAGPTLACGTGCVASVAISQHIHNCEDTVNVHLPLGQLSIKKMSDGSLEMTGPSQKISKGVYYFE